MKLIYVSHRDNTVLRVSVIAPPQGKGYRLEFFEPEGSFSYDATGKQIRDIAAAVEKYRAELQAGQQAETAESADTDGDAPP